MKLIIADITRANLGTEQSLVNSILERYESHNNIVVYIYSLLEQLIDENIVTDRFKIKKVDPAEISFLTTMISSDLDAELNKSEDNTAIIVSFHSFVLTLASRYTNRVSAITWKEVLGRKLVNSGGWPEQLMPIDEAVSVLVDAMNESNSISRQSAQRASDLRSLLVNKDSRFNKSNPVASKTGLIKSIVNEAEERKLVHTFHNGTDPNYYIWLAGDFKSKAQINSTNFVHKGSISGQYIEILKGDGLGPFSGIRHKLFNSIEELIGRELGFIETNALINQAVATVKSEFENNNGVHLNYPWRRVRSFLLKLLSRNEVLLNIDEKPFRVTFSNLSTPVTGLVSNWRTILDSDLILALIENGVQIQVGEIQQLSGALFYDRDETSEQNVIKLIEYLLNRKLVVDINCTLNIG
ncbi:hypothetical protein J8L98_11955 [Pseudoalteromonas sp. MMG013]|uniref:hypothetical protein n=1 Tax=Pseudoalteromonas sp. MMG013 TaxID=2822687 RepID=UPI001B369749|nr:hypothetical protein [Pseudoalteromonas sp. MMG013]MBQ4862402.1 hypothetical protein [Pseudoalteromonas sp. MMG013]